MSPPIRVKPASIFSTSSRGSLLDGAYTSGVAYANPFRRGQMSPRLVLLLAAFTTFLFLVSNFNSLAQPPLEDQTFMEDDGFSAPPPCCFDLVSWNPPPSHQEPVDSNRLNLERRSVKKCPRILAHINDEEICELENLSTNLTSNLGYFTATRLSDSAPAKEIKYNTLLLPGSILALVLLGMLFLRQASTKPPLSLKLSHLPRTIYTDNPTARSLVDTWDLSSGSFMPATFREQLYFPKSEEANQAIDGLSGSPCNSIPPSHPPTKPKCMTVLRQFLVRICMEVLEDVHEWMPVGKEDASDQSSGSSTSSKFDEMYEEFEVEEIGIDYSHK